MPNSGIQWQAIQLSLGAGIETTSDVRSADSRRLAVARDVQFDETGGIQLRKPFGLTMSSIFGGGALSSCRRIETVNGELVLFTSDSLYSWNAQLSKWVLRGTHLAVSVSERPAFATTGDQFDGDRAELNGTVMYAWVEGSTTYLAAADKVTGAVLMAPTSLGAGTTRPRLAAAATKIIAFYISGTSLLYGIFDPANPAAALGAFAILSASASGPYDVTRIEGQDGVVGAAKRVVTTSYTVFAVMSNNAVTSSVTARTCDGPIAVASLPSTGLQTQIIRGNGTNVQGDLVTTSTFADVFTAQAIGAASASLHQIAVAYSSVAVGGFFVATAFWSRAESDTGTDGSTLRNTVTNNNVVGTAVTVSPRLGVASRAFSASGRVFVWLVFARINEVTGLSGAVATGVRAALQNTYFLYRDDSLLVAKSIVNAAGGHAPSTGRLPGVAATSGTGLDFAWCGAGRRIIDLGGEAHTGFEARQPIDVAMSLDANGARRCARLGETLYVTGGLPLQYDGVALSEIGFMVFPYNYFCSVGGAGNLTLGTYIYKGTFGWSNARGERERSTTAFGAQIVVPGANRIAFQLAALNVTRKSGVPPAAEVWRTEVNSDVDPPFYLVTGKDPTVLAGSGTDNGYIPNDSTASVVPSTGFFTLSDNFADATLTTKELNPENGAVLESLPPPGASIIFATDTRIFIAGVAGDPDSVRYSRLRGVGEVASFHDTLVIPIPRDGGDVTALAILNETLVVFRETSIYALPGQGFDNTSGGQNYGPANRLSADVGAVSMESVALTPMGLVFKSSKGWYLLDRGWGVKYIGADVAAFDGDTVYAAHVVETQHQVRVLTSARMLVWDYIAATEAAPAGQWAEWTVGDGLHATIWNGSYVYLTATGPRIQAADFSGGVDYGLDIETAWIKLADLQGAARVRKLQPLGEYRSAHLLRARIAYNYNATFVDDKLWTPSPTTVGGPLQVAIGPKRPQCEAVKLRLTAVAAGVSATLVTTALSPVVAKVGGTNVWTATFRAVAVGAAGNALAMSLAFETSTTGAFTIDVRDHFAWSITLGIWTPAVGAIGVRVVSRTGAAPTIAQLEAAIVAGTGLATLTVADAASFALNAATVSGNTSTGTYTGGTYTAPTGEALKLTGLGLEVGADPGLYRRLPAAQKA